MSTQAVKVILFGFVAGMLAPLAGAFLVAGAPPTIAVLPFALVAALAAVIGRDLRHVARHGWWGGAENDGSTGPDGGTNPPEPSPLLPSGDSIDPEWDRFVAEFWEYAEHQRELVGA